MATFVFDSSSIISISDKCLIQILERLSGLKATKFVIAESVFEESVLRPLNIKRFELNALRIKRAVDSGWLGIEKTDAELNNIVEKVNETANSIYSAENENIKIIQKGEIESLALIKKLEADALVIDERTTRMLIENPSGLLNFIGLRYQKKVRENSNKLDEFRKLTGELNILRSVDLIALAYENDCFEPELEKSKQALEAAMYAVKFAGCAVSSEEIREYLRGLSK